MSLKGKFTSIDQVAEKFAHLTLPAHSGRQYRALAESYCTLADGKTLVGTQDGMLAIVDGDKLFSLGAVSMSGGIHSLAASPDGTLVYGVAGDPEDLGMIFEYSVESGIKMHGCIYSSGNSINDNVAKSCEPCCVAFAPDGKSIAIGVRDRMGCVYHCIL